MNGFIIVFLCIVLILAGAYSGISCYKIYLLKTSPGIIQIDRSDEEIPYLRLDVTEEGINNMHKHSFVTFTVDPDAKFTRKKQ